LSELSVSVILPTFNRRQTIERAIKSVLEQNVAVMELIVVDDGSTDGTEDLVAELCNSDERIVYFKRDNAGACAARNFGVSVAKGELIAFQDSDDEWEPTKLARQMNVRIASGPALVFTSHTVIFGDGSTELRPSLPIQEDGVAFLTQILEDNFISTQTVLVDKSILADSPMFDTQLKRLQDWDLWLSLCRTTKFVHVAESLVNVYRQEDSLTVNSQNYYVSLSRILRKHWRLFVRRPRRSLRHLLRVAKHSNAGAFLRATSRFNS
jgi:glycosyltransferase involved in cell wall biosynthesis